MVQERILSGLSAEMADYKSSSGEEDEDKEKTIRHHKFTQPDHVKMVLKSEALKLLYYCLVYAINVANLFNASVV